MTQGLWIDLPDALVDAVADRVLERLGGRDPRPLDADTPWLRGADAIAAHIGCPRSRVYALTSAGRMPCVARDGSALVARPADLDAWVAAGGARRP